LASKANVTTRTSKGQQLSYAEIDGNFTSLASAVNANADLMSGNAADAGTLTGAELAPIARAGGTVQATLTKIAQWIIQTYQGFTQSGAGAVARAVQDELRDRASVKQFGAKGDGVTLDDAAFAAFEALYVGCVVDLGGFSYKVTSAFTKNAYHNGVFVTAAGTREAALFATFAASKAKFKANGGQLRALHKSLVNPLEQQTTIGFLGDSITWGLQLADNGPSTPRTGTLGDQRDNFTSASWVNEFKRFVGAQYFGNAAPTLSNWSYSSGGQSSATYARTEQLYTGNGGPITLNIASATNVQTKDAGALLGYRHTLGINPTGSTAEVSFTFTGSAFNLRFTSISAADSADYEVFVNGTSQGVFSSFTTASAYKQSRTHTFGYVRNGTVKIATRYNANNTGVAHLNFEAIEVIKQCTIHNQGVIGTTAYQYQYYNFGANGPTVATPDMNYVFLQLGTNDRANTMTTYSIANGILSFKSWMNTLLGKITPTASVILMVSNPAANESPASYSFTQQDVRNMVHQLGVDNTMDVIDNYTLFSGMDSTAYTADGLHPNLLGHAMYARNIINAIESA
jgi:lysophospholipase L1-like esterase